MERLLLKMWWTTYNPVFDMTPEEAWARNQHDAVINLVFALQGDQRDLIRQTLEKIRLQSR